MRRIIPLLVLLATYGVLVFLGYRIGVSNREIKEIVIVEMNIVYLPVVSYEPIKAIPLEVVEDRVSDEDIELIALVTMAEAEGECEKGKRLVIDTILNRVDSKHFPNTIYEVVYQPRHFSSMWNGRLKRCKVMESYCQLVREELKSRTNYDVTYFMEGRYSIHGTPLFKVEHHYFSSGF